MSAHHCDGTPCWLCAGVAFIMDESFRLGPVSAEPVREPGLLTALALLGWA